MFNVLVSGNGTAWETDQLMRIDKSRFGEYSGSEVSAIELAIPESLIALEGIPSLLMYEGGIGSARAEWVRYGTIHNIRLAGTYLIFRFREAGAWPLAIVREFSDRLGMEHFEFYRTHWAVKDGTIPSSMMRLLRPLYEVVLSFAGEDRAYVEQVAAVLKASDTRVFYDTYEQVELWGKDLAEHLDYIYRQSARFCVPLISKHYEHKMWTRHERRAALARALEERSEYILPARVDDTEVPGILHTVGYVSLSELSPSALANLILQKLGRTAST